MLSERITTARNFIGGLPPVLLTDACFVLAQSSAC